MLQWRAEFIFGYLGFFITCTDTTQQISTFAFFANLKYSYHSSDATKTLTQSVLFPSFPLSATVTLNTTISCYQPVQVAILINTCAQVSKHFWKGS